MRDWLNAFLPASFRGVPFKVEVEQADGGRRLSISPIAYADTSVIEDMGRDPRKFSLTAYQAGDFADRETMPLIDALDRKGASVLVLPMLGPQRVRVLRWSYAREKTRAGYVAIDVDFIEEGLSAVPFLPVLTAGPLGQAVMEGGEIAAEALSRIFDGAVISRLSAESASAKAASTRFLAVSALSQAGAAVQPEIDLAGEELSASAGRPEFDPAGFARSAVAAWRQVGRSGDPDAAAALTLAEIVLPKNAIELAEQSAIMAAHALASVRRNYRSTADARIARERLSAAAEPLIEAAGGGLGDAAYGWLSRVTGEAAMILSRIGADRAPIVIVEAPVSLPSTAIAYRLYGDAERAGEIVDRNVIATPLFMPLRFEALSN